MHCRYSITLLVITILFLSFILLPQDSNSIHQLSEQENVKIETSLIEKTHYHPSYEFHDRISIYDNDDFSEQGWPGAGTLENPYLIEGLEIV